VTRSNPGGSRSSSLETVPEGQESLQEERRVKMERPRIGPFDPKGELTFEQYYERWEMYFDLQNITDTSKQKNAFVTYQDEGTYALIIRLCEPKKVKDTTFASLIGKLKAYFQQAEPSKLVYKARFNQRVQGETEPALQFITSLSSLATKCDFKDRDEQLIARIVSGLRDTKLQETILASDESKLTVESVSNQIYIHERAEQSAKKLSAAFNGAKSELNQVEVNKVGVKKKFGHKKFEQRQSSEFVEERRCYCCGKHGHIKPRCFIFKKGVVCGKCGTKGHMTQVCDAAFRKNFRPARRANFVAEEAGHGEAASLERQQEAAVTNYLMQMESVFPTRSRYELKIELNCKPIVMEIDTGATFSLIGMQTYRQYFGDKVQLSPSKVKMRAWGQKGELEAAGALLVAVKIKHRAQPVSLELLVMQSDGPALIGRNWFKPLGIGVVVPEVELSCKREEFQERKLKHQDYVFKIEQVPPEFQDLAEVFSPGLGRFKGEPVSLRLKENFRPVEFSARQVPFALQEKTEKALNELEAAGVLEQVMFSEWATPIVVVEKGDGVRICADFSATVNPQVERADYPLPTLDSLLSAVKPGFHFSKIDLADAYLQFEVDEEASKVLTITTLKGRYRFKRMPPGLCIVPAIFQKKIQGLLSHIPGVFVYFDDIFIFASTKQQLTEITRAVLIVFFNNGLKVKLSKCAFDVTELEYLGYQFTQNGVKPTEEKVKAVQEMRPPQNVEELRAYLGYVNYYDRFIPNKANIFLPVYRLLRKDVVFQWTSECQAAMDTVKAILTKEPVLAFYDPRRRLRLVCDGSRKGIGAVLSHIEDDGSEVPILYISRALKKAEQNYSQMEIEALAIVWAVRKLKKYLWGRVFQLKSDHKPLLRLFGRGKPIPEDISAKLKRYCLFMRDFDYEFEHMPGIEIANADILSRLPLPNVEGEEEEFEGECRIAFMQFLPGTSLSMEEMQRETDLDEELKVVKAHLLLGRHPEGLKDYLKEFKSRWENLKVVNHMVCFSDRAVVPRSLRAKVMELLHLNHFGETKMKSLARSYFWWPKIDEELSEMCKSCQPCALVNRAPNKAPVIPWSVPHRPWGRVHLDFFEISRGKPFIIAADGLSGWIDADECNGLGAKEAIKFCRKLFRMQGVCDVLVADNGPAFRSEEFIQFCKSNGVELIYSPPYSPATNGVAERAVQTVKNFLKKTEEREWPAKLDSFLLGHNSTPKPSTGVAPAEFNLGRRPQTLLDKIHPNVELVQRQVQRDKLAIEAVRQKPRSGVEGQPVTYRTHTDQKKKWSSGTVEKVKGPRRVLIRTPEGPVVERHADQVKFHPLKKPPDPESGSSKLAESRPVRQRKPPSRYAD